MSLIGIRGKEDKKRINLTLPTSLFVQLEKIRQENDLKMQEAIRSAIEFWIEYEMTQAMAEGYRKNAKENAELMEEFKHVDEEIW